MGALTGLLGAFISFLVNILRTIFLVFYVPLWGLWNLALLIWAGLLALFGSGSLKERLGAAFTTPDRLRSVMAVLRAFMPTIVVRKKFITAYENTGTAVVTAYEDVLEVVNKDDVFHTTYEPKMALLTKGDNFFLGMQAGADYLNNVSDMRLAANRDDVEKIIVPFIQEQIPPLLARAEGKLDIPHDLLKPVLARLIGYYFGTPGPSEERMIDWTHKMFAYIFFDFSNDAGLVEAAKEVSGECRDYLDDIIATRKKMAAEGDSGPDDVLGRCLRLQQAEMPFMDDGGIRNNFLGMTTAMLPTISNATTRVLDQFLDRPDVLRVAQKAAREGDDDLLNRCIVEAFRFNPMNPVIFRRAAQDHILAAGTLRQRKIPKGCFVFAANLSAMFDPWVIPSPGRFDVDRSPDTYILWGLGLHRCFGEHISRAVMPLFLKEILKLPNVRRAKGPAGQMDMAGTPFPQHLTVEFD